MVNGKVAVQVANVANIGRYVAITRGVDVQQSPSIVVIDRNRAGTLLTGYVDDLHQAWHHQPVTFADLESIHFYRGTCVLKKLAPARRRSLGTRIDAAAARRTGAWTG